MYKNYKMYRKAKMNKYNLGLVNGLRWEIRRNVPCQKQKLL